MSSLETIKPYFQDRMRVVDPEMQEWEDAFNDANIPSNVLNCAWHITISPATLVSFNQQCLSFTVPISIKAFEKGFRTPNEAVDSGLKRIEAIIKECCRHSQRLTQPFIKKIDPTAFSVDPIAASNDNIAKLTIDFICLVHIDIET